MAILAATAPAASHANECMQACDAEFGMCANNPDPAYNCGLSLSGCYGRCSGDGSGSVAQRSYGAIAISPSSMDYGYSYQFPSQQEAERAAIGYCAASGAKPGDCKSVVWFYDACGALAVAPNGKDKRNFWGSAWAESKRAAERKAMGYCNETGARGCKVAISYCSPITPEPWRRACNPDQVLTSWHGFLA